MEERVVLVDTNDQPLGLMPKMEAHEKGVLHRAFSVFILNDAGELMLQQRALHKYHSPGLWTNTCCSHQRNGESNIVAGKRRLQEEMGLDCTLTFAFKFVYKVNFSNGLSEHECDHVYFGYSDALPQANPLEVQNYKYIGLDELQEELSKNADNYSEWLKICLDPLINHQRNYQRSA